MKQGERRYSGITTTRTERFTILSTRLFTEELHIPTTILTTREEILSEYIKFKVEVLSQKTCEKSLFNHYSVLEK